MGKSHRMTCAASLHVGRHFTQFKPFLLNREGKIHEFSKRETENKNVSQAMMENQFSLSDFVLENYFDFQFGRHFTWFGFSAKAMNI